LGREKKKENQGGGGKWGVETIREKEDSRGTKNVVNKSIKTEEKRRGRRKGGGGSWRGGRTYEGGGAGGRQTLGEGWGVSHLSEKKGGPGGGLKGYQRGKTRKKPRWESTKEVMTTKGRKLTPS